MNERGLSHAVQEGSDAVGPWLGRNIKRFAFEM
jgi:hypothetical protein